jgi:hypothetical protein
MKNVHMKTACCVLAILLWIPIQASFGDSSPPRAARSVHLGYLAAEAEAFYTELAVEKSVPGSYFMACGFSHGYFGIQELAGGKKVVLFSVWDPTKGNDPGAVAKEHQVEVLYKADEVVAKRFGGEGTGGQSFFTYDWKPGQTYRFLVKAAVTEKKTAYAACFYLPESKTWKHLVTFRTFTGGDRLKGLYSFIEDFRRDGKSATEVRRAVFGSGWVCTPEGRWEPLTKACFTASGASWEAKETIDAGGVKGQFYLQTGGDTRTTTPLGTVIERPAGGGDPPKVPSVHSGDGSGRHTACACYIPDRERLPRRRRREEESCNVLS